MGNGQIAGVYPQKDDSFTLFKIVNHDFPTSNHRKKLSHFGTNVHSLYFESA
jgi:hypothetical protein